MRTAQILKHSAFVLLALGIIFARKLFEPTTLEFWFVIFIIFVVFVLLRLFANIGQLIYEIRNDVLRILGNAERALYYSNALAKEIRDLLSQDTVKREKE